jgi:hypothetical protein
MTELIFKVIDSATKMVEERAKAAGQAHASALKSSGFRLRQLIKQGMKEQAPGGEAWPRASAWVQFGSSLAARARAIQRRTDKRKRQPAKPPGLTGSKGRTPLSKLAGGARYETTGADNDIRVRIGFLNPRLQQLAAYHAVPHTVPVTAKMRRLIFAVGLGISKSTINIPARPHVAPVYRKNQARIQGFCQQRINAAFAGRDPKSVAVPF